MSLFVKLCGVRTVADLRAAEDAGADAVGVVMSPSVRQVDLGTAHRIKAAASLQMLVVGVFFRPTTEEILTAQVEVDFDLIQAETGHLAGIDGIRSLPVVHDGPGLAGSARSAFDTGNWGRILVEGPGHGGTGSTPDLERVSQLDRVGDVILAGGLTVDNVARAIQQVRPGGVDVSSGIEATPGVKDHSQMARFVEAARRAHQKVAV